MQGRAHLLKDDDVGHRQNFERFLITGLPQTTCMRLHPHNFIDLFPLC